MNIDDFMNSMYGENNWKLVGGAKASVSGFIWTTKYRCQILDSGKEIILRLNSDGCTFTIED